MFGKNLNKKNSFQEEMKGRLNSGNACYYSVHNLLSSNLLSENLNITIYRINGFGGLGVACWPLVPKFAGSNPAEAVGFLRRKNPQHAFLRRGNKAVCPMS